MFGHVFYLRIGYKKGKPEDFPFILELNSQELILTLT